MSDESENENENGREEAKPRRTPPRRAAGNGGKGAERGPKRQWREEKAHRRWGELCDVLLEGSPEEQAEINMPEGAEPADVEVEVERIEPPDGPDMPRIPGGAIYRRGQSAADCCFRYVVDHYHSRFKRERIGAVYQLTFYWRLTNRYITRCQLRLAPYEEIHEQVSGQIEERVPGAGGPPRRLPFSAEAVGAGGYTSGADAGWREAFEEERRRNDKMMVELRESWRRTNPTAPLPEALATPASPGAGAPPPIALDANAIVEATTRGVLNMLAEAGILTARAPVGAPTSTGGGPGGIPAGYAGFGPRPTAAEGVGLGAAFAAAASESPRVAAARRELQDLRDELLIKQEIRDLRDEFAPEAPEAPESAAGAGATAMTAEEKPPFTLTPIPGAQLYGEPVFALKEHEKADGIAEMGLRWAARAPGLAKAVGGGLGRFLEGAGGAAVGKIAEAGARLIDRIGGPAPGAPPQAARQAGAAEVVSSTPRGAVDATPYGEGGQSSGQYSGQYGGQNGAPAGASGWPQA